MSRGNSLQAALTGAATDAPEVPALPKQKARATVKKQAPAGQGRAVTAKKPAKPAPATRADNKATVAAETTGRYRDSTVMVGGHFPPHVLRQLRMIAAEEDTTNQALIAEALDLLFTRKGKSKIGDLSAG